MKSAWAYGFTSFGFSKRLTSAYFLSFFCWPILRGFTAQAPRTPVSDRDMTAGELEITALHACRQLESRTEACERMVEMAGHTRASCFLYDLLSDLTDYVCDASNLQAFTAVSYKPSDF